MQPLALADLREELIRQEETIIFALIERAQFKLNAVVYDAAGIEIPGFDGSFLAYMLFETERIHARVRRYTSPDEHAFCRDLPEPVLPDAADTPQRIKPNRINRNAEILDGYRNRIVPQICEPGDCGNYGSSAVCDVNCLQALSKRIHYGKFIAEAKFQAETDAYTELIQAADTAGIMTRLRDADVEAALCRRVALKAATYGQEPGQTNPRPKVDPDCIAAIYRDWIIPLTCRVEVDYLLARLD